MIDYAFLTHPSFGEIDQIHRLYREAGWWPSPLEHRERIDRIVSGSHCFAVAVSTGVIIGMGRTISDGASDAYIQDVTVRETERGQGIGKKIVCMLISKLETDGIDWIGLIAERNSHGFYQPLGFKPMPDAKPMLYCKS